MGSVDELTTLALKTLTTINNLAGTVERMHNQNPANTNLREPVRELKDAQEVLRNTLFAHKDLNQNSEFEENKTNNNNNSMRR